MLKTSVRYFMSVVRHGSIRAASAELNVAQSAVSRQLQALEHELGTQLLERRARGVCLTQAGELLYAYGRQTGFQAERFASELDALRGLRRGHVRLAVIESLVPRLLPRALKDFNGKYPGITFSINVTTTDKVVAAVKDGSAEIGVGFSAEITDDLACVCSVREPLLAVVSSAHPLADADSVSVRDLTGLPMLLAPKLSGARHLFDQACLEAGVTITPAMESTSLDLTHRIAVTGVGIAVLMRHSCHETVRDGTVKTLKFKERALNSGTLDVITLAGRQLPLAAEKFLDSLRAELRSPGGTARDQ